MVMVYATTTKNRQARQLILGQQRLALQQLTSQSRRSAPSTPPAMAALSASKPGSPPAAASEQVQRSSSSWPAPGMSASASIAATLAARTPRCRLQACVPRSTGGMRRRAVALGLQARSGCHSENWSAAAALPQCSRVLDLCGAAGFCERIQQAVQAPPVATRQLKSSEPLLLRAASQCASWQAAVCSECRSGSS